ncbi:MAG: 50S ribosomal protein L29 [Elusimicrobia bacterium RIFCSPLOWO2_01_FULL_64_13]|nr:MAG: 50S ribosomal protein L29 [Elusimicrobia bacterium RIFCSPHIGHO2_01_FULL_64_10]OGR95420.1 MAG: 50S ribosomal protein L29 [Elusimicrobia bacterium RIFCSPLOWO2_01_FULL_64_13]
MKTQDRALIQALPRPELLAQLKETEEKLFKLRLTHSVSPLKNGLQIRNLRKHRARLKTWLRQNEIGGKS